MIDTPIIHDRYVVKRFFENMKSKGIHKNAFKKPKNLTILTAKNEGEHDRMIPSLEGYNEYTIFEQNLDYLGIHDYVVLNKKVDPSQWKCSHKINWVLDYINSGECDTELILCCDAIDVIFTDDLQKVINIFENFECDLLFMSTHDNSGYNFMPDVQQFVDKTHPNRYLNAGVWIGRVEFVKEFLMEASKFVGPDDVTFSEYRGWLATPKPNYPRGGYDQDIFRYLEPKFYPRLKVDYENKMAYRK
tara:strand:+ start:315 stop:1052 length:738 start_codon:yes stop_codon:yes gene_type:complete